MRGRRRILWVLAIALSVWVAVRVGQHQSGSGERLVERVIVAVQQNDIAAVKDNFDSAAQASMTYERVGRLADLLAPMGKLLGVSEMMPKTSGEHRVYLVRFEHGEWEAMMPLDNHGKVTGFSMQRMQT